MVYFGAAARLAVNIEFETATIGWNTCDIFPSKRKIVPWYLLLIAFLTVPNPDNNINIAQHAHENPEQIKNGVEKISIVHVDQQTVNKAKAQHHELLNGPICT